MKPERYIYDVTLPLLMQHWFVLTKYVNVWLYTVIELAMEVWFEWTVFSDLQRLEANHKVTAFAVVLMLIAHWQYLLSAALELFVDSDSCHEERVTGLEPQRIADEVAKIEEGRGEERRLGLDFEP